jgi:flagellar protein FliS
MRSGDITLMNNRMQRAEAIVNELRSTLNFEQGGEIAVRLDSIYSFCQRHMLDARLKLDPARIEQVMKLLADLRDAWDQVAAKS